LLTPSFLKACFGDYVIALGTWAGAGRPAALRRDVLVLVEEVVGIVCPFDLHQPVIVLAVVVSNLAVVIGVSAS
jgi:hypothetical protein